MGTDSAPHPKSAKETAKAAAGVFVTPFVAQYLKHVLEGFGAGERLEGFACRFGRAFYGLSTPDQSQRLKFVEKDMTVPAEMEYVDDKGNHSSVVPFLAGKKLKWSLALFIN